MDPTENSGFFRQVVEKRHTLPQDDPQFAS